MAVYPYYDDLQKVASNMSKGNFGLWFNKLIPISNFDSCKASDERGNENNTVSCYHDKYNRIHKDTINRFLAEKHRNQQGFCSASSSRYEPVIFKAKLKTPLITGIGESHPHEVSMVFDHNMGIPYIPASGIKGIVRFAHTLGLLFDIPEEEKKKDKEGKLYFDDEKEWTQIPRLFGTQAQRGSVVFLDAYPENVPDLHIDIMNPHYGDYYSDDKNKTPPADYLNPNPIKFLTVAKDTAFIFRALVDKEYSELVDKVKNAFKKALTEEGVGAKTAVGYGLFEIIKVESVGGLYEAIQKDQVKDERTQIENPADKFIQKIKLLKPTDAGPICTTIDNALAKLESGEDKKTFAQAVKAHMGKSFRKSKAQKRLEPFLK